MRSKLFLSLLTVMVFILIVSTLSPAHTAERRTLPGTVMFAIEGKYEGRVLSMSGGNLIGTISEVRLPDSGSTIKKSIQNVAIEALEIEMALDNNVETFNWLNESINGRPSQKTVTIFTCDLNFNIIQSKEYLKVIPAGFSMSNPDVDSKINGKIVLSFNAEQAREGARSGKCPQATLTKPKTWFPSNFRLDIPGLDTVQVRTVSGLEIAFKNLQTTGNGRNTTSENVSVKYGNLMISLSATLARTKSWEDWYNTFLVQGRRSDQEEKSGTLVLLSPDMKNELLRINLSNLGLFKFENNFVAGPTAPISNIEAGVYVEKIDFDVK